MKTLSAISKIFLAAVLFCSAFQLVAEQPATLPPHGKAYGYYLRDGTYVLFVYEVDGTRSFTLSKSRPNLSYLLEATENMTEWTTLGTMVTKSDGTTSFIDTAPNIPHRYYRVTPTKAGSVK